MQAIRGDRIAMIFQEPMNSLNPALTVGLQVAEPIHQHRGEPWARALDAAKGLLQKVQHPRRREPAAHLSAPVLGRHAPARDDRDGAGLPARA